MNLTKNKSIPQAEWLMPFLNGQEKSSPAYGKFLFK
jgi:hypothetical protein